MKDLTIIFLTVNKVPQRWADYHLKVLKDSIGDTSVISVSKKPMDFGINLIQTEPESSSNIYWQMLKAGKIAKTPYIAIVEDDVLYNKEHFKFRPELDTFAYNMSRWSLFTWGEPTYSYKQRIGNFSLIAPRKLMIEALEERFAKYPYGTPDDKTGELGKPRTEKRLGITRRKLLEFNTVDPIIQFSHDFGTEEIQRTHKKRRGWIRAYDIPYWGSAKLLQEKFR